MTESGNAFVISLKAINSKNLAPCLGRGLHDIVNENLHNLIFCKHEVKILYLNDISFTHL